MSKLSDIDTDELFGQVAAEDDRNLDRYFLKNRTFKKLSNLKPLRILIGHKGTGKSAMMKIAKKENDNDGLLSIFLTLDDIIPVEKSLNNATTDTELLHIWKSGLKEIIQKKIFDEYTSNTENKFTYQNGVRILDNISKFFKLEMKNVKFDLSELKSTVASSFEKNKKIIIYIDDLDQNWSGDLLSIKRIGNLISAIRDLANEQYGLCFRLSLRNDMYSALRKYYSNLDKVENDEVIIKWTQHELLKVLVKRIQSYFKIKLTDAKLQNQTQDQLDIYLKEIMDITFHGRGKWANKPIHNVILSLVRNRPRDLITLCTLAKNEAENNEHDIIETSDWESIFKKYSQKRLENTISEHKLEMENDGVDRLLRAMKPNKNEKQKGTYLYSRSELLKKIRNILSNSNFRMKNNKINTTDPIEIANFLYKIGFVVARKTFPNGYIQRWSFEDDDSLVTTDYGYYFEVHPAFRWALNPELPSNLSQIDYAYEKIKDDID